MKYQYMASVYSKNGKLLYRTAPFNTHLEAVLTAFRARPKAKTVSVGYGFCGSFNIHFYNRRDFWQELGEKE